MFPRSFTEYQINLDKFKIVRRINKGGFGVVYLVKQVETSQIYAAKIIDCNGNKELYKKIIDREVEIMLYAHHPTIVNFIGFSLKDFQKEDNIVIIMELAENGSLLDIIQKNGIPKDCSNTIRQIILIGIARGMKYLHDRNIIHRDLKPGNILLDKEFHPHISDFGMSKFFEYSHIESQSLNCGTLQYMAPEVIDGEKYDTKADVYSFGILMYEVVSNSKPYPDLSKGLINNFMFIQKIINEDYRPIFNFPIKKSIQNLIEKCWSKNSNERPTFKKIFNNLAYGKSEEDEEDENLYYLDDVDVSKILSYVNDITEITDPIEHLNRKIDNLEKENNNLKSDTEKYKESNIKLSSEKNDLSNKNEQLLAQNEQLTIEKEELLGIKKNYLMSIEKLSTENKHLSVNYKSALDDSQKLHALNNELSLKYSQLSVNSQHLTDENNQNKSLIQQLEEKNTQLQDQNISLQNAIEEFSREKNDMIMSLNNLKKNNESLTNKNDELSNNNTKLSFENKKLTKDNNKLLTYNKLAENKKEQLSNSINSLNEKIAIISTANDELSNDLQNIIKEYETQIISHDNIKFIREINEIKIRQFNTLPLVMQKLIMSNLLSIMPRGEINQFLINVNNLMLFLLRFNEFNILNCIKIKSENNDQLFSKINCNHSIILQSNVFEILYSINEITSYDFISILHKINFLRINIKYPNDSFKEILDFISDLKTNQFSENQIQISVYISEINELDSIFQNNKHINLVKFSSFAKNISTNLFKNCSSLTKIKFDNPSLLHSIDQYSFYQCFNLKLIEIPSSVTILGSFSFCECSSLTQITIPSSVTRIEEGCFKGCKSLQKILFSDDSQLYSIDSSCFNKCSNLGEVIIPSLVREIQKETFSECNLLSKVILPLNILKLGDFSFYKCMQLCEINIPSSVIEIGDYCFYSCSSLKKVNIPFSVTKIGDSAFNGCNNIIEISIPSSVTHIGESSFMDCSSLTHISIPSSITSIGNSTFKQCTSLTNIEIPFSVTSIGDFAFYGCSSLDKLIIPHTIISKGANAFSEKTLVIIKYTRRKKLCIYIFKGFIFVCVLALVIIFFCIINNFC